MGRYEKIANLGKQTLGLNEDFNGPKSYSGTQRKFGRAPKVGGTGVALEVGEIVSLSTPLCTPLFQLDGKRQKVPV